MLKINIEGKSTLMNLKKLNNSATIPTRGSVNASGYDLYACIPEDITIKPHTTAKIGTGLAMKVPDGYAGLIYARSGLATKQGLRPSNCTGVVDPDYTGEWIVALYNDSDEDRIIHNKDRIAQMIITPFEVVEFNEVDELEKTDRGAGGFGSTGN